MYSLNTKAEITTVEIFMHFLEIIVSISASWRSFSSEGIIAYIHENRYVIKCTNEHVIFAYCKASILSGLYKSQKFTLCAGGSAIFSFSCSFLFNIIYHDQDHSVVSS